MSELPFQLFINCLYPEKRTESISCTALLRCVPGRRKVFDAFWNNRSVIVKVFTHKLSAKRHVKREWKGLTSLSSSKLNAPEPLFFGQTEKGDWIVVVKKIEHSTTALEVFNSYEDSQKKLESLIKICRELAFQHQAGILQKDFHLENFIFANDKIFTLDPAQMRFYKKSVSKMKRFSNLAMLLLCLKYDDIESQKTICEEYFQALGQQFSSYDELLIQKQINVQRKKVIRHGLKKTLRTSKRYIKIKTNNFLGVFNKSFCIESEALDFIDNIDDFMSKGKILKDGNTSFVSHFTWNNKDIVVKRYNHKSYIHSLRHTLIKSRAIRGWLHAQRLTMLGIPTPKALAFVEQRKGFILWNSYYVSEYADGISLYSFLNDVNIPAEQKMSVKKLVEKLLDDMGYFNITHGDLKHSNILITKNGPVLTDLDAMQAHKLNLTYNRKRVKDIKRLHRM